MGRSEHKNTIFKLPDRFNLILLVSDWGFLLANYLIN
jgi:hypothetical protein